MTEAVHNNNAGQQRSQDSWCQAESSYSDRSINETDFLGDVDYEWLCGYGGRPARVPHAHLAGASERSALLAPPADPHYSQLSYHVDTTLAELDMDEYYRGDINRILEISGYDGDLYEEDEKEHSSPLFSSTREQVVFNTISMDSLDCSSYEAENIARSCRTNMNNYTIAFEGSMTSSVNDQRREFTDNGPVTGRHTVVHHSAGPMTTWSEQRPPGASRRAASDGQSKSMPDALLNARMAGSVLVYDVSQQEASRSLLRLFVRQRPELASSGGQSSSELLTAHTDSCSDCPMKSESESERHDPAFRGAPRADSSSSDSACSRPRPSRRLAGQADHAMQTSASLAGGRASLYVCYPHYSMPNLRFLDRCPIQASVHLCPTASQPISRPESAARRRTRRPYSCNDAETLRRSNLSHIRDWGSLRTLLPPPFCQVVDELGYGGDGTAPAAARLHGGQCASATEAARRPPWPPDQPQSPLTDSQLKGILRRGGGGSAAAADSQHEPLQLWLHGAAHFAASSARDLERMSAGRPPPSRLADSAETGRSKRVSFSDSQQEIDEAGERQEARMRLVFGQRSECVVKSRTPSPSHPKRVIIVEKETFKGLLAPVIEAVNEIVSYFQSDAAKTDQAGDNSRRPASAYLVLDRLCPALYSILSQGLLTTLETAFGEVQNSGWRLVESVTSLGACPQALQDLVMKLNNEDGLSEGVLKFNAFIFGLLNTQSLDSWFSYLRTRESVVRKHYSPEALLYHANCAARAEYDALLLHLQRLAQLSFSIDLLFESRMLYQSLGRLGERLEGLAGSLSRAEGGGRRRPRLGRPRSTVEAVDGGPTEPRSDKKRWSGLDLSSKLLQALDAILSESAANELEHTDDDRDEDEAELAELETEEQQAGEQPPRTARQHRPYSEPKRKPRDSAARPRSTARHPEAPPAAGSNKDKFHKLQQQWEKMAKGQTPGRRESRIPRPVSSRPGSAADAAVGSRPSHIPKPCSAGAGGRGGHGGGAGEAAGALLKRRHAAGTRLLSPKEEKDEENRVKGATGAHTAYSRYRQSRNRQQGSAAPGGKQTKRVRSLAHYHAADRSYLSYDRHEALSVVGEVDRDWLLCARHDRVGLVARRNVLDAN